MSRRLGNSTVEMTLKVYTHIFEEANGQVTYVMNYCLNKHNIQMYPHRKISKEKPTYKVGLIIYMVPEDGRQ